MTYDYSKLTVGFVKYKNFSDELWQKIRRALAEEKSRLQGLDKNPVAVFDADGTLWDTDLGESFFKYQIKNNLLANLPADPWRHYRDWKEGGDPRPAYLWLAQINSGVSLSKVREWAVNSVTEKNPLPIFEEQKQLIEFFLQNGVDVWIVTASVKWAVEPGAERLGISEDRVVGIETSESGGVLTDQQKGFMTYRQGKADALLSLTHGQKPFFACGNTIGDEALLTCSSGISLAVGAAKPSDELFSAEEKLRSLARERNWDIHYF